MLPSGKMTACHPKLILCGITFPEMQDHHCGWSILSLMSGLLNQVFLQLSARRGWTAITSFANWPRGYGNSAMLLNPERKHLSEFGALFFSVAMVDLKC